MGGSVFWLVTANDNFTDGCARHLQELSTDKKRTRQAAFRQPSKADPRVAVFRVRVEKLALTQTKAKDWFSGADVSVKALDEGTFTRLYCSDCFPRNIFHPDGRSRRAALQPPGYYNRDKEAARKRQKRTPIADQAVPLFSGALNGLVGGMCTALPTACAVPMPAAPQVDVDGQLSRLASLHAQGALTDAEFTAAKAKVLFNGTNMPVAVAAAPAAAPAGAPAPIATTQRATAAAPPSPLTAAAPAAPADAAVLASAERAVAAAAPASPPPPLLAAIAMPPPPPRTTTAMPDASVQREAAGEEGEDDEVEVEVEQEEAEAEASEAEAVSEDEVEEVARPLQSPAAATPSLAGGDVQISAASGATFS